MEHKIDSYMIKSSHSGVILKRIPSPSAVKTLDFILATDFTMTFGLVLAQFFCLQSIYEIWNYGLYCGL